MFKSMMAWRIAIVSVIYGVIYLGYKQPDVLWLLLFAIPFTVLFRPFEDGSCDKIEKMLRDGFPFYLMKWGSVAVGSILILTLYFSYQQNFSFIETAPQLLRNTFVIVPIFLTIFISWSVHKKNYYRVCIRSKSGKKNSTKKPSSSKSRKK